MSYIVCRACHKDMPKREIPLCVACAMDNGVTPGRTVTILPDGWTPPAAQALREAFIKINVEEKDLLTVLEALATEAERIKQGPFDENLFRNILNEFKNFDRKIKDLEVEVENRRKGLRPCSLCGSWDTAVNHHGDCRICAEAQYA